jgi:hypothetical protein
MIKVNGHKPLNHQFFNASVIIFDISNHSRLLASVYVQHVG